MSKKGKSICIFSPKGGVGKTILAMNLAGIAALKDKKTLLIDLDLFNGAISMLINENISKTIYNLSDDLNNNRFNSLSEYVYHYNQNIDILSSPKDPRQGNKIESKFLEMILNKSESLYDLIIIDTSNALDEMNLMTLDTVDLILFVITDDIFNIKNLRNILNIFKDNEIDNYKILLNDSVDFKNPFFTDTDIKKILDEKIDYYVSKDFYMKNITSYLYNNTIPVLANNNFKRYKKEVSSLYKIIIDVLNEGDISEEK